VHGNTNRNKQTQKQKKLVTIISIGFVTPVQSLTVNNILRAYLITIKNALIVEEALLGIFGK
jgi:hypothetical protein